MGKVIDLKESFYDYFYKLEGFTLRAERFYEDIDSGDPKVLRQWLEAAFMAGAKTMADDTLDTLQDYGTAVAGIDLQRYTGTEAYDNAAESLKLYYDHIFREVK